MQSDMVLLQVRNAQSILSWHPKKRTIGFSPSDYTCREGGQEILFGLKGGYEYLTGSRVQSAAWEDRDGTAEVVVMMKMPLA